MGRGGGGKKSNQGHSSIFPSKERPSVSPELSLEPLRVWEGREEKEPTEQKGKYLLNSNKTRPLPRNAQPVPHLLYREKAKPLNAEAHSWSRCSQFFTAHNSSSAPPTPHLPPPLHPAAGGDAEGWGRALPGARAIL